MATASLGRLTLDLVARISSYTEPLSRAERETRRSTRAISESFDVASLAVKGFGVVMGGLSVAGVIAYSEKVITAGNDIQKFSKLANASTAQLQYYAKGAESAGISLESFADKMKDMQDRIGDFQQTGGGPLADFFTNIGPRVGVTIQQFQKLSGPEALQLFYNSLEKAGASTNDMKFYMEQIISDSSLLIPLLEKNGQGFKFWGDAAQEAGAIMSDEMVKSLADAKVQLQLMNLQWQGLEARLINGVVPVLQTVVQNWDQVVDVATVLSAILIGRVASSFIGSTIQIVANNIATQRKILADYELAKAELSATAAMVRSMGAINAETAALMANARATYQKAAAAKQASLAGLTLSRVGTGLLGIFGGPLGLATTALAVGASLLFIKDKSEKVTDAFDIQGKSISDLVAHYNSLGIAKKRAFAYEAAKDLKNEVEAYNKAKEAFYDSAVNIAYGSVDNQQAVKVIDDLVAKFKAGKISAEEFANGMDKLGLYTDQQILTAVKFAEKVDLAKSKMDAQKNVVDALKIATDAVNKSQKDQTKTVNDSASAWQNLTEKQRKYIEQVNTDLLRDKYISDLVSRGFTPEKANAFADAQANTNEGSAYKKPLQSDVLDATLKRFNSKNYTFGKQDLAAIAKVQGIAKANNFAQIESLYGLPKGALAALVLQESRGNANAISPTGAKGLFQTTSVFRKEYGLTSRSSVEAQAIAAAKDLEKNLAKFGSIDKALMAYNAGAGGLNTYLKGGLSASKRKEVAGYAGGWAKWFAGVNDKTTVDDSILMPTEADILQQNANIAQAAFELSEKRKEVDSQYYSESEKLAKEHQDRIDKITQVYTGTDQLKTRLAQEDVLYKEQVTQLEVSRQKELNQLKAFETDRISQIRESYDEEIRLMQVSTKYVGAERSKRLELLERAKQAEIDAVKREEEERVQSAFESYLNETDIVVNRYKREREEIQKNYQLTKENREKLLQANQMGVDSVLLKNSQKIDDMSYQSLDYVYRRNQPNKAAWTDLENQYYGQQGALDKAYSEQRGGIFSAVDDENERNSQLLAAHEQYLQAKAALDDEFAQRGKDLVQSQHDAQMNIWQDLLTRTGTIFSSMAEMIKNTAGESSAAYKVMFLTNQSISMAQAMINTEVAATKAMAEGGYVMGIPMASAIRGLGYASVGLIAAQTIAGMAHNGIDNIPREGTWLLDGGERVLNPQQNKDLTNYLNQRQSAGSGVNVVINNYGNDKVQTSTGPDGSLLVEIGKMVDGAVDRGIQRNMKQGFPLDRAFQRK